MQLGSGKYGDTLRVLAGGGSAANQVEYTSRYGSALPVVHSDTDTITGTGTGTETHSGAGGSARPEAPILQSVVDTDRQARPGASPPSVDDIARSKIE